MSKVTWPRQALGQLQLPGVCAVTGQPATTSVRFIFQSPWARYVPGIAGLVLRLTNPAVRMNIPLSAEPAGKVRNMRYLSFGGLGLVLLGIILGVALVNTSSAAAGVLFWLLLIAGVALAIVCGTLVSNVIGAGVDGQWIYMNNAHPAFVDAFMRINPPGMVQVPGGVPQQQGYVPPQGYAAQGYAPQGRAPEGHAPQQGYQQPPQPQQSQQPPAYLHQQAYPYQQPPQPGQQGYGQRPQGY